MHSAIERQKRFVSVFCVNDWMNIFKLARSKRGKNKNKPPYETEELKFSDMLDLKELSAHAKKKNLLIMYEKLVIPEVFHPWFNSLASDSGVRDVLPEADILDSEPEEEA
ncbi:hypothetical protein QE152_g22790 [Popillia japonica]|uniref:Uncharacterized protein n=1 Tax=Popillia japonica TaxID=7064 RepID=A0AAW1KJ55_POPJA